MYNVPQDLRAKPQIIKGVDFTDFLAILTVSLLGYFASETAQLVASRLAIAFNIFNVVVIIFLIAPSRWNKGKKNYQSLLFALTNDKFTYHTKSYPYRSTESCLDTPIIDQEIQLAALEKNVDLDAIRKEAEEERLEGLK